jgi:hypothetical protein
MKELDCISNQWVEYGQDNNGIFWSILRDASTKLVNSAITAKTMDEVKKFWHQHGVVFADTLPTEVKK